jgi:7-cyano-7-deazaguanine synthase
MQKLQESLENKGKELLQEVLDGLPELEDGKNVCLSYSGGLDSTVLLHLLVYKYGADRVKTMSFNFGQNHNIELDMVAENVKRLGVYNQIIKLDYLRDLSKNSSLISQNKIRPKTAEENSGNPSLNSEVSFRNAQFAMITAAFAENNDCSYIAQGLNSSDGFSYWDTTLEFTNRINAILELNRKNVIKFISPFVEWYKSDELLLAKELEAIYKFDPLEYSWSCYHGKVEEFNFKECGTHCNSCAEKLLAYVQCDYSNDEIKSRFNVTDEEIENIRVTL